MKQSRNRLPLGTLRLRGSTFWAQWKHGGLPFAMSLGTKSPKGAKTNFAEQMTLVRASILDGTHAAKFGRRDAHRGERNGDMPIASAWDCFVGSPRRSDCSAETLQQYLFQFGRFVEWVGKHRPDVRVLSQVTEDVAMAFASHLQREVSPSTYNRYRDLLLLVFRVLSTTNGHTPANPWAAVQRKRVKKDKSRRAFTVEELRRIFLNLEKRAEGRQFVWAADGTVSERRLAFDEVDPAGELLTVAAIGMYTGLFTLLVRVALPPT